MARYIMVVLVVVLASVVISASGSSRANAGTTCEDPTPNGGGVLLFKGIGTPVHAVSRDGDVCPGQPDVWSFAIVGAPIQQVVGIDVVEVSSSVNVSVEDPSGTEFTLDPGNPVRITNVGGPGTYTITVSAAGDALASYRVQVCRALPQYDPCPLSDTVTPKPGDVDCSGAVDAGDALVILQFVAALIPAMPCQNVAILHTSVLLPNAIDALLVLQFSTGLLDAFPIP